MLGMSWQERYNIEAQKNAKAAEADLIRKELADQQMAKMNALKSRLAKGYQGVMNPFAPRPKMIDYKDMLSNNLDNMQKLSMANQIVFNPFMR